MLAGADGNIKLADFGSSKRLQKSIKSLHGQKSTCVLLALRTWPRAFATHLHARVYVKLCVTPPGRVQCTGASTLDGAYGGKGVPAVWSCLRRVGVRTSLTINRVVELCMHRHGTPYWMSPEAVGPDKQVGKETDIWSMACLVVEMFTKKPPFSDCEPIAAIFKIGQDKTDFSQIIPSSKHPKRSTACMCFRA